MTTRKLFVAILFLALFVMATREISDPDFWWHLRTGQFITETFSIPRADIFSHTNFGKPWVTHEWLSELFIYAIFLLGSFPLLTLVFAAIIMLSFALVYARCDGKPLVAGFAVLFAALATAPTWGVRPQMLSMLMVSVFLWVLNPSVIASEAKQSPHSASWGLLRRSTPRNDIIGIWILIPLMILWVNLHSGFALGIAILGIYLFGKIISVISSEARNPARQPGNEISRSPLRGSLEMTTLLRSPAPLLAIFRDPRLKTLAIVFFACLAVVPLNPNGATMYVYPFETLTSHAMQTYIQEWFSPDFHAPEFQPFAFLLLATLESFAVSRQKPSLTELLLLVGSGYAGLRSARNIPIFALIAAPILARNIWDWLQARDWDRHLQFREGQMRGAQMLNWVLFLLVGVAAVARIALVVVNQSAVEREKFPAAAVDFLKTQGVKGELYNSYGWGGYLIWRLYPTRVFIDGRADVYGDAFIEEFLRAYRANGDWRGELSRYNAGTVLIEPDAPLALQLAQDAGWKKAYEDKMAVIFEK